MGNSSSTDDEEDRETEVERQPDVVAVARPPAEDQEKQGIEENLHKPFDNLQEIKSKYDEIKKDTLKKIKEGDKQCRFNDPAFPAADKSLYVNIWGKDIEWKSPHELSKQAKFVKEGLGYNDIEQGQLGDCWWMSSVAAVCKTPKFINRIIPSGQRLAGSDYIGAFHFRFWRFGHWVDVVVDDKLPTSKDALIFAKSTDHDEFWISLLEKAYAKINGSYQALHGGFPQDALEDLTGGLAVTHQLEENSPMNLYSMLQKACKNGTFVCCATDVDGKGEDKNLGLVSRHAYTVTGVKKIHYRGEMTWLVRIRNPWAKYEWKGDWSDSSSTWSKVDQSEKNRLGYTKADNGEWWMSFKDFVIYFTEVTFCTIGPDFDEASDQWYLSKARGSWIKGATAGGCSNSIKKFATNPQYYMELREPDEFNEFVDDPKSKGKCAVVIGLMQEYRRLGKAHGPKMDFIGFSVYKAKSKPLRRLDENDLGHKPYLKSGKYTNVREVNATSLMSPGHYVIIPSTFDPDKVTSYLLRIYTEKKIHLEKLE